MRHAVAAVACLLLAGASSAGAQPTAPKLRILQLQPRLVVRGSGFEARRQVRVTLVYEPTRRTRLTRATTRGWFVVLLGALPQFDPCHSSFRVVAVGRAGDRAELEFTPRECPNP